MSDLSTTEQNGLEESGRTDFLTSRAAYQLAEFTKTVPQFESVTPRWLPRLLKWKPLENGIFRLNRVKEEGSPLDILNREVGYQFIPEGYVNYEDSPREYVLNPISTIVKISTQVSDLYSSPYDQSEEQLRLSVECMREGQDYELINSPGYGLLTNAVKSQRIRTRNGRPTPDDLDELISKVWKEPSFFLAHPRAIAAFGRECTRRGVPRRWSAYSAPSFLPGGGSRWYRPISCDQRKLDPKCETGTTNILLVRTGKKNKAQ
jgi:hypothetical protein